MDVATMTLSLGGDAPLEDTDVLSAKGIKSPWLHGRGACGGAGGGGESAVRPTQREMPEPARPSAALAPPCPCRLRRPGTDARERVTGIAESRVRWAVYAPLCALCVWGMAWLWHFRFGRGSAVHQRHGRAARGVAGGERGRHRHAGEAGGGRVEGRAAAHRGHHQHQPGRRAVDGGAALGVPRALRSDFSDDSPGGRGGPAALRRDLRRRRVGAARRRAARTEPAGRQCQRHRCHAALAGRSVGPPARSLNRPPSHRGSVDIEWFRAPTGAARTARAPQHPLPSGRAVPLPPCRRRPYP